MTHIWIMGLTILGVLVIFGVYGIDWNKTKSK